MNEVRSVRMQQGKEGKAAEEEDLGDVRGGKDGEGLVVPGTREQEAKMQ
jgi:hypothetical protein